MRACSGVWVAHGSGSADRETVDAQGPRRACRPARTSYLLRRVWLTRGGRAGLLLRLRQRGPLAALPHRARAARSSAPSDWEHYQRGQPASSPTPSCEEVDCRRPDRPRAGLPLRAGAADDPRAAAARDDHHLLAHPVAELRALRHLPVARRAPRRAARQQHPRLPHAVSLQQLLRLGRPLPRGAHRPRARRGRPCAARARWCGRTRSRSSGRTAGRDDAPPVAECRATVLRGARPARTTRCSASASIASTTPRASRSACWRSSGCSSASRSIAAASPSCSSPRRAASTIERYRELERPRARRWPTRINERFGDGTLPADHPAAARTTSRRDVFRYYRAADLCYVSSLHDGMNLVAKEFVAARDDEQRRAGAQLSSPARRAS